ncbi:MAG TPA: thiamine pyrophosphate-dependent enzyme, partial [Actinomycetota bacterium]|nr:thiamine pyrophosphate-dependent enzyme [Actinomycetota bacterium]
PDGAPWELVSAPDRAPSERTVVTLSGEMASVERGVLVAGGLPGGGSGVRAVADLAAAAGWPLVAEPTSGLRLPGRALAAGQALLQDRTFADAHAPDVVFQVGSAPTTRATQAFVASARRLIAVDPDRARPDPGRASAWTIEADPGALAEAVLDRMTPRGPTPWLDEWQAADAAVRKTVDDLLDSWDEPFEGRLARDLAAAIPDGGTMVVGSSMPIRDLDAFIAPRDGLRVLANRGASGIDGFVSTVLGVAASGAPTYALCGDLALLHDASGLLWAVRRSPGAVFVVPNNDGGIIFSFLAQRDLPELRDLFTTPHGADLAAIAEAAGCAHGRIDRAVDLIPAVTRAADAGGAWILEAPSDGETNVARHAEVAAAVAEALS